VLERGVPWNEDDKTWRSGSTAEEVEDPSCSLDRGGRKS
jgi:hypothetical protein